MFARAATFFGIVGIAASVAAAEYLVSEQTKALNLPFSDAVRVGEMLYLSGQLGNIPGTNRLVPGGIEGE